MYSLPAVSVLENRDATQCDGLMVFLSVDLKGLVPDYFLWQ
jgi:hypothetical protein